MKRIRTADDGWEEVIAPLTRLVDLDVTARESGALRRRRAIRSGSALLRMALAWAVGGQSLRQTAAWASAVGEGELCDSAVLRRLRKAAEWLGGLVEAVLGARLAGATGLAGSGRLIRLVDGSTFGVPGTGKPGWRLHAGFDLPGGRLGPLVVTPATEGEGLERLAVTAGELRIADRGFARPGGLRHVVEGGGAFLVRLGSRSLKLQDAAERPLDWATVFAHVRACGLYDRDVHVCHSRYGRKRWPPLPARLIVVALPGPAAQAARGRLDRAGQREGYTPSAQAVTASDCLMLLTSIDPSEETAAALVALYRLRWQVELAFKRLKSLLDMRVVPTKDPGLARTWLCAHLLVALLAEDFGAELGAAFP